MALAMVAASSSFVPTATAAPEGVNLLTNPGFESPYGKQCCHIDPNFPPDLPIDEVQVAYGWRGWWHDNDATHPLTCSGGDSACVVWHRPEWREAFPYANRIRSGNNAQKYFTFYSVHEAGMYQTVGGITPGQRLQFGVWMHAWSTAEDQNLVSSGQQSMHMRVGIDPYGGSNPWSANVVWGTGYDSYDIWGWYSVEAVARNSVVTVFTYSRPVYPLQHNDIYLDDAALVVVSGSASARAAATATPALDASRFTTYTVQSGDNLYKLARRFGTSTDVLVLLNRLSNSRLIKAGQQLIVPITSAPTPDSSGYTIYTVQSGDNLYKLARRFGTTEAALIALNNLKDPRLIKIGQQLLIPR